jgi:hypothetical protein
MPGSPKIYSVEEANAVLPRLRAIAARQCRRMAAIEAAIQQLRGQVDSAPADLYTRDGDTTAVIALKTRLRRLIAAFREEWDAVERHGVVVTDVRAGVVDFYTRRGGCVACLCWRYGESTVSHWHPVGEGFDARRPLEVDAIPRRLN